MLSCSRSPRRRPHAQAVAQGATTLQPPRRVGPSALPTPNVSCSCTRSLSGECSDCKADNRVCRCRRNQLVPRPPARRNSWTMVCAGTGHSRHIPDHCSVRSRIEQQVIGVPIAVEIGNSSHSSSPAGRVGPVAAPMRTLLCIYQTTVAARVRIEQQIIGIPIAVEISQSRHSPAGRKSRTKALPMRTLLFMYQIHVARVVVLKSR